MCSLRFENNFLPIKCVRFASKIIFFLLDMFAFALKTVVLLSNVFVRFENNLLTIEGVRVASISKKTPLSKLSFAFVSLALPLLAISTEPSISQKFYLVRWGSTWDRVWRQGSSLGSSPENGTPLMIFCTYFVAIVPANPGSWAKWIILYIERREQAAKSPRKKIFFINKTYLIFNVWI